MNRTASKIEQAIAEIVSQQEMAPGIFDLRLAAPEIAAVAAPGQFVNAYCPDADKLLPRPLSICDADRQAGEIRLVYRVSGAGTASLAKLRSGDELKIMGPLGTGFPVEETAFAPAANTSLPAEVAGAPAANAGVPAEAAGAPAANGRPAGESRNRRVLLVGGGIGIPPLLFAARALFEQGAEVQAVLGYSDSDTFLAEAFAALCPVTVAVEKVSATDRPPTGGDAAAVARLVTGFDPTAAMQGGDRFVRGTVLDAIRERGLQADVIFSCGPTPMLRALQEYAREQNVEAYLSLEERMACGVGACLACVCRTRRVDAHTNVKKRRVCKDGPVFPANEVVL